MVILSCRYGVYGVVVWWYDAGEGCTSEDNIDKLLKALEGENNLKAYFETELVVYQDRNYYDSSGKLEVTILTERLGHDGFGYESVFYTDVYNKSLAQLSDKEKNSISHRARAIDKLVESKIL